MDGGGHPPPFVENSIFCFLTLDPNYNPTAYNICQTLYIKTVNCTTQNNWVDLIFSLHLKQCPLH